MYKMLRWLLTWPPDGTKTRIDIQMTVIAADIMAETGFWRQSNLIIFQRLVSIASFKQLSSVLSFMKTNIYWHY